VRFRLLLAALAVAAAILPGHSAVPGPSFGETIAAAAQQPESATPRETPEAKQTAGEEREASSAWQATIARASTFALVVGAVVYFLLQRCALRCRHLTRRNGGAETNGDGLTQVGAPVCAPPQRSAHAGHRPALRSLDPRSTLSVRRLLLRASVVKVTPDDQARLVDRYPAQLQTSALSRTGAQS